MSKYNHIKSIPVDSIPKEELSQAIKEWSEGDESMEKLLWACFENKLKTSGCHAGINPYIGFDYEKDNNDKFIQIINETLKIKGAQVLLVPDGGNPFSGSDWYKPSLTVGFMGVEYQDEADPIFDMLTETINSSNQKQDTNPSKILELLEFLIDKYSDITIRIRYKKDGKYIIYLERRIYEEDTELYEELNSLFTPAGLTLEDDEISIKSWMIQEDNLEEFEKKVNKMVNYIINNYSIEKPKSISDTTSFKIKAHIKRDECLKKDNLEEFELWLMNERKRMDEEYERYKKESKRSKL